MGAMLCQSVTFIKKVPESIHDKQPMLATIVQPIIEPSPNIKKNSYTGYTQPGTHDKPNKSSLALTRLDAKNGVNLHSRMSMKQNLLQNLHSPISNEADSASSKLIYKQE